MTNVVVSYWTDTRGNEKAAPWDIYRGQNRHSATDAARLPVECVSKSADLEFGSWDIVRQERENGGWSVILIRQCSCSNWSWDTCPNIFVYVCVTWVPLLQFSFLLMTTSTSLPFLQREKCTFNGDIVKRRKKWREEQLESYSNKHSVRWMRREMDSRSRKFNKFECESISVSQGLGKRTTTDNGNCSQNRQLITCRPGEKECI